jgi:hypothetical protein
MIYLLADKGNKVGRGCQIFMPETLFFKEDGSHVLTYTDRDCCIAIDNRNRNLTQAIEMLQRAAQDRAKAEVNELTEFKNQKTLVERKLA